MSDTKILPPTPDGIAAAGAILRAGGLVAMPTETVYGLAADATNARAVARVYEAKGRPAFNPLIAHLAGASEAGAHGRLDGAARRLAAAFWPGPLTLVVPLTESSPICDLARAGLASVGLRVPGHPLARALIEAAGCPLAAPSANRSGRVSPTSAQHVLADLRGRVEALLDAGPAPVGVESSIVACLGGEPRLLRAGGVPREALEAALGRPLAAAGEAAIAPGMTASHYAPRARVHLKATRIEPGWACLAFGPHLPDGAEHAAGLLNLSARGDLTEAAANLFAHLRALDAGGPAVIAVAPIPASGLGEAINDRLARAAAGR